MGIGASNPDGFPPQPKGVPVFGYLPYLQKEGGFSRIAFKHGQAVKSNAVCVDAWFFRMILFNKFEDVKEIFVERQDLACRTTQSIFGKLYPGRQGIIFENGDFWKDHRAFALSVLKDSGITKQLIEQNVADEVDHVIKAMDATDEKPTDFKQLLLKASENVYCQIYFGQRYDYDDENFAKFIENWVQIAGLYKGVYLFKPWMLSVPECLDALSMQAFKRNTDEATAFINARIEEHKEKLDPDQAPKDYIDAYLLHMRKDSNYTERQLADEIFDFFFASAENIPSTLLWSMNYLAKHPDYQTKVQSELDEKIGGARRPRLDDRTNLPYTEAVFMETQRKASVTPFGAPHCNDKDDMWFGEFLIPKGCPFCPNIYAVHHDPDTWRDPMNFNPHNFLDETDGTMKNVDRLIPNGLGNRSCVGYGISQTLIYLVLTAYLQRYKVECPNPEELDAPPSGLVEQPSPFHVRLIKRQ